MARRRFSSKRKSFHRRGPSARRAIKRGLKARGSTGGGSSKMLGGLGLLALLGGGIWLMVQRQKSQVAGAVAAANQLAKQNSAAAPFPTSAQSSQTATQAALQTGIQAASQIIPTMLQAPTPQTQATQVQSLWT